MNIYVGNLSLEVTEEELRQAFMDFGEVLTVTVMNDKYVGSGQPRGYGYVEMSSKSEGTTAVAALNGKALKHMAINVIEALPLSGKGGTVFPNSRGNSRLNKYSKKIHN
jgi:RNA recognition motif-containing protein